jgi:outer membrane receptor for ferrienterochelin and colicins
MLNFKLYLFISFFLLLTSFLSPTVYAGIDAPDAELQKILSLDIEQLTTVSIASKREEPLKEAPGIITVITAEDIKRYGYRNLRDILDRQTNMQVIGSNLFPHNRITLRGVAFSHTDNVVLLLLNGRPMREATSVNTDHDIYAAFPVEAIDKIEIIRGPGSVLYGTNAFAGVVNIITKKAPVNPAGSVSFTYGSFDYKKGAFSGGGRWGDLEIFGAGNALDINGDDFHHITDEAGNTGTYKTGISGGQIVFNAKYKDFTLNTLLSDTSRDHARSTFILPSTENDLEREFVDLGYKHNLTDKWDVSINGSYHHYRDNFLLGTGPADQLGDAVNYLAEITTHAQVSDKLGLLAGGTYTLQEGKIKTGNLDYSNVHLSAYMQLNYWLLDWIKLIGGFQYNKPDGISGDFSPRMGAIVNLNDNWGVKLLYGQAFRQASPVERFIMAPSVIGNPKLVPETIDTYDAQLFYNGKHSSFAITYYHSTQDDLVTRVGALPAQIVNSGEVVYDGFELEGKLELGHGFEFIGNLSYQTNEKNDGTDNVTYAPDWMAKTGLYYDSGRGATLGLFNSYFAASTLQNIDINPATAIVNPGADSYNLLTANLSLNLGKVLKRSSFSMVNVSLYGDNLLDEDIFFPSISRTNVNTLPHHDGRGIYGTIQIDF